MILIKGPHYRYHEVREDGTALCGRARAGEKGWTLQPRSPAQHTGRCGHCYNVQVYYRRTEKETQ